MKKNLFYIFIIFALLNYIWAAQDFYTLLGVSPGDSQKQIQKAFQKKSAENHPDKNPDNEEVYKMMVNAYETLRNKEKRAEYDTYLKQMIKELTADQFYEFVQNSNEPWIIKFHLPWCQPCIDLQPEWNKLGLALNGIINVGSVDMSRHGKIGEHYSSLIEYYPAILFFGIDKGHPIKYQSENRKVDQILEFAYKQTERMTLSRFKKRQDEDVFEINDHSFENEVLKSQDAWFIDVDASWCANCIAMQGEWNTFATFRKDDIKVAKIEGPKNKLIRQTFNVQMYPTLVLYPKGEKDKNVYLTYNGNKDYESFNEQLDRWFNYDKVHELNQQNFQQSVMESDQSWYLQFCVNDDPQCRKLDLIWNSLSQEFQNANFGKIDIIQEKELANRYNVTQFPTILFFDKNQKFDNMAQKYAFSKIDEEPLHNWVLGFQTEEIVNFNEYSFDQNVWNSDDAWFISFYVPWAEKHQQLIPTLNKLSGVFKGRVKIGKIDVSAESNFVQRYKLVNFPSLVYFPQGVKDESKIKFHSGDDYQVPTLERWILGQDDSYVIELSDEEIQERVMQDDDAWFIQFYIPFDETCKKFQPEFNLLAKELRGEVHVAKMNCWTEGVICGKLRLDSHPGMHFFPPGSKAGYVIKKYDQWEKDTYSMLRWIRHVKRLSLQEQGRL